MNLEIGESVWVDAYNEDWWRPAVVTEVGPDWIVVDLGGINYTLNAVNVRTMAQVAAEVLMT